MKEFKCWNIEHEKFKELFLTPNDPKKSDRQVLSRNTALCFAYGGHPTGP